MPHARAMLPESWATKGRCPLCAHTPLRHRPALEADQLACPRCGVAFEVEDGGPHVRLRVLPSAVTAPHAGVPDGEWRTPKAARAWVRDVFRAGPPAETHAEPQTQESPEQSESRMQAKGEQVRGFAPAPTEVLPELSARARQLLELGHPPPQIQSVLERAGEWTREQVQAVMEELLRWDAERRAKQRRTLAIAVSAIVGLTLILAVALALLMPTSGVAAPAPLEKQSSGVAGAAGSTQFDSATAQPTAASLLDELARLLPGNSVAPDNAAGTSTASGGGINNQLPPALQTLIPPGVTVLNAPTPVITRGEGPAASQCPVTKVEAAQLFGGQPDQWQAAENVRGWMLFSTSSPVTVRVPANMTLGYLEIGQSLSITDINGPATVTNVYLGAMSCE